MADPVRSVAVLGTGIMGAPMARNIARSGLEARAWNRTCEKAEPLANDGIAVVESAAAATEGADAVVTMLTDAGAVRTAMTGDGGALAAMPDDAVWCQMGTIGIEGTEEMTGLAADRGVQFVDAPVVGTKQPAESGELIVLASGPDDDLDRCEPIFEAVGSRTVRLAEAGGGTRMKLVVNSWLLGLVGALAETVALAERIDVDPADFLDLIKGGPVGAPYAELKGRMMIEREFPPAFPLRLVAKDAHLVREAAEKSGVELRVIPAVEELVATALEQGYGDEDMAAAYYAAADSGSRRG
jgi:3-hydroxyisobutyrate dehydrogenase